MTRDVRDAAPTLADDAVLAPFRESGDPVLTTEEVCESVSFGRGPTEEKLAQLAGEGVLERKAVGDGAVWWVPGHTATDERREPMAGATREDEGGLPRRLENAISMLEIPDESERAAIYAICYHLAERGPTSSATLREDVHAEHSANYDDAKEWWNECIRPALAALPGVEREDHGERADRSDNSRGCTSEDVWRLE